MPDDWELMNQMFLRLGIDAPPLPDEPTEAMPGSQEKLEVMRRRLVEGRQMFHPDDRTDWSDIDARFVQVRNLSKKLLNPDYIKYVR